VYKRVRKLWKIRWIY